MHASFYVFVLCALAGWSVGYTTRLVTAPPPWLVE